ncbi:MAG: hypothetical protein LBF88_07565 [Planctomycetaceae bacterium]|jgi:hypothetical protein|nr:hypothetical protein [Planctomycetaceae bacterium]
MKKSNPIDVIRHRLLFRHLSTEAIELRKNFTTEKFEKFVDQAKKLSVTKPAQFKPIDPLRKVIDILFSIQVT